GYGFNKSHAAAYALIAYQTAYLKANHPREFIAASMTLDMGNTDKLYSFTREAKRRGIAIMPPSVNKSAVEFEPEGSGIRYALAALKNMGQSAAEHIVAGRGDAPFRDLADFMSRINPKTVNKRAIEALNAAGGRFHGPARAPQCDALGRFLRPRPSAWARRGPARRNRHLPAGPQGQIRQPLRIRRLFRSHRAIRGSHFFGHAHIRGREARTRQERAHQCGGRGGRRGGQSARADRSDP
ncbi:MAG: DNA polymerase III subunit alpha, partial [Rhodomicrobium sp.]|nr:DNA polymerase III subunit alpha [Rhodomicrobium sp.]